MDNIRRFRATEAFLLPTDSEDICSTENQELLSSNLDHNQKTLSQLRTDNSSSTLFSSGSSKFNSLPQSIIPDVSIIEDNDVVSEVLDNLEDIVDQHNIRTHKYNHNYSPAPSGLSSKSAMDADQTAVDIQLQTETDRQFQHTKLAKDVMICDALNDFLSNIDDQQVVCIDEAINLNESLTPEDLKEDDEILIF